MTFIKIPFGSTIVMAQGSYIGLSRKTDLGAGRIFALLFPLQIAIFKAMPRLRIGAWTKTSAERVGRLIERKVIETGANFARSHLQKLWDWTYSLYNMLQSPNLLTRKAYKPFCADTSYREFPENH